MQYVRLGSTGLKVSRLCLGCMSFGAKQWREWVLDEEASRPFIQRALEAGMRIACARVEKAPFGVDTFLDLERARRDLDPARRDAP